MNRRTSFITAAAVGGAVLAGTGAIAANISVLSAADDDSIGNLSAEAPVATPAPPVDAPAVEAQVLDVYVEDPPIAETSLAPTTVAETPAAVGQQFTVEAAGAVTVEQTPTGLIVSDVQANEGWTWSTEQSSHDEVTVTFRSGDTTYEFSATVGADGVIEAHVDQPIVNVVRVPAAAPAPSAAPASSAPSAGSNDSAGGYSDDDDEDDEHDDEDDARAEDHDEDHDEHDVEDDDHHEGREDDD